MNQEIDYSNSAKEVRKLKLKRLEQKLQEEDCVAQGECDKSADVESKNTHQWLNPADQNESLQRFLFSAAYLVLAADWQLTGEEQLWLDKQFGKAKAGILVQEFLAMPDDKHVEVFEQCFSTLTGADRERVCPFLSVWLMEGASVDGDYSDEEKQMIDRILRVLVMAVKSNEKKSISRQPIHIKPDSSIPPPLPRFKWPGSWKEVKPSWKASLLTVGALIVLWLVWLIVRFLIIHFVGVCIVLIWVAGIPIAFLLDSKKQLVVTIIICFALSFLIDHGCSKRKASVVSNVPEKSAVLEKSVPQKGPSQSEPRQVSSEGSIALPDLSGTPFEALSRADKWASAYRSHIIALLNKAVSEINNGKAPSKSIETLQGSINNAGQAVSAQNGIVSLLSQSEQKMRDQIKEIEKMSSKPGLDPSLKQQYGDTLDAARKNLESFKASKARIEILAKEINSLKVSIPQWKTFHETTAGLTGSDAAKTKLVSMIVEAANAWGTRL